MDNQPAPPGPAGCLIDFTPFIASCDARDYERLPQTVAGLHWLAFITIMLNALFR